MNPELQSSPWFLWAVVGFGLWAVATGSVVITARRPVHAALALVSALMAIAGLFAVIGAEFLAGAQVLVYVGGVMVLFIFVIMVVGGGRKSDDVKPASAPRVVVATVIVFVLGGSVVLGARMAQPAFELRPGPKAAVTAERERAGLSRNTEDVGTDLYTRAALPFEVASLVLLVAIVGAVVLAKGRRVEQED
jgi:NADH-quinone oxidoreductase subunit J